MNAFDLDPSLVWLFCFTHPDDELALAGWIGRLTAAGAAVWMSWTHDTPVREAEARRVAARLGVAGDRLFFHHGPDGKIAHHMPGLLPKFADMMLKVSPDRVVSTAFEQGHIDHDATNFMVNQSFEGPVFEVPLYHTYLTRFPKMGEFAQPEGEQVLALTPEEQRLKKELARMYPSQTIWRNVVCYSLLQAATLRPMSLKSTERLRLQTHRDFRTPHLPAPLAARVQKSDRWNDWLSAVERVSQEPPVRQRVQLL